MRRVIVCGSRNWNDRKRIRERIGDLGLETENLQCTVIHGNAPGADRMAANEAKLLGLLIESHPADWDFYGRRAGIVRNVEMAKAGADLCIAFYDGSSPGTAHMIKTAQKHGIPVEIILEKREETDE